MGRHDALTRGDLVERIASGEIDTVIVATCDMQGRLIGKRVTGDHFVEHGLAGGREHGTHLCIYLLATDMEMTTPDGFARQTWDSGYGDDLLVNDWATLRVIPWLERTALVLGDLTDEATGEPIAVAPRQILRRQVERAEAMGFTPMMATELEFYLLRESYEEAHARGYRNLTPFSPFNEDYQLFQNGKVEPILRRLRNEMSAAGVPIEFSKGEAAPGQHEVNIHYSEALEAADRAALFRHGAREIAWQAGHALTFMARPDPAWTGSSGHIHISLRSAGGTDVVSAFPDAEDPGAMSDTMRWFLGGVIAAAREFSILMAHTVNAYKRYAVASWAPVNVVWGRDNRTCGIRVVGRGDAMRIENRLPGADSNPYLAFAALLGAGLTGIERRIEPPDEFLGNAYIAEDVPRIPAALYRAIDLWTESTLAREVFGADVHAHYLTAARVEQEAFDRAVTDWERHRYLERG